MSERSNEQWLAELNGNADPGVRAAAINALRERLQRGVYYYLSHERSDLSQAGTADLTQMAQDFAQDAVLRILDNLETFRGDSKFTTWAMKIAARVAVSELRRARYRDFSLENLTADGELMLRLDAAPSASETSTQPEKTTERKDAARIIQQAFEKALTERQRIALEAVSLQGIPMDVVAQQMETNRNALYKLLHDARKKLKAYLEEEGLPMDYVMALFSR